MTLLVGALTLGGILSLLALGVFLSFRIFAIADMTVDGVLTLGAAVTAILILQHGCPPLLAVLASLVAGLGAGSVTGLLQTRLGINPLLSGILMMTALYSVNLRVMGKSNLPLIGSETLVQQCSQFAQRWITNTELNILGWVVTVEDMAFMAGVYILLAGVAAALWAFLKTDLGTAMRASGDNPQMIQSLGGAVGHYRVAGLALSNGIVAVSGSLWAQYQSFVDAQMGIGMIVWGLASLIIGEALLRQRRGIGYALVGAILGSVFFRELIAIALSLGLNPNDLKLVTALFVLLTLTLSHRTRRLSA